MAFDPLDGSSIVDTNFTVGTIFGVWPGDKLIGVTGRDQVMHHDSTPCRAHLPCSSTDSTPGSASDNASSVQLAIFTFHIVRSCI